MTRTTIAAVLLLALFASACGEETPAGPLGDGKSVYADVCSVCHGGRGQGGVGPALDTVVETFPSCSLQQEWISLGSEGWKDVHGEFYGATEKKVGGAMPRLSDTLTPEQIAAAALYERVEFGGLTLDAALADCGFPPQPTP